MENSLIKQFEKARLDLVTLEMYKASVQIKKYDAKYLKFTISITCKSCFGVEMKSTF